MINTIDFNYNYKIIKNTLNFFTKFKSSESKNDDNQILDPFTTIVTLAIIGFKNVGTKIAISNNKIFIQPPNLLQGALRYTYGNNREEVHYLLKPIFRAITIYYDSSNDNIQTIFKYSINGLRLLKESYNNTSSTLSHAIDLYIQIIDQTLKNNNYNTTTDTLQEFNDIKDLLKLSQNTRINLDNFFKELWKKEEIDLISTLLKLSNNNRTETKYYIKSIENILSTKETQINDSIAKANKLFI